MLKRIFLEEERYKNWQIENVGGKSIGNLSKLNLFIGTNNSGKSRFLRTLFSNKDFKFELEEVDLDRLQFY